MNRKLIRALALIFLVMTVVIGCKDEAEEKKVVDILTAEEENKSTEEEVVLEAEEVEDEEVFIDLEIPGLPSMYYSKSSLYYDGNLIIEEKWTDGENTRTSVGPEGSPETAESVFNEQGTFFFILSEDDTWVCPLCINNFDQAFGDLQGGYPPGYLPPGPGWDGPNPGPGWHNPPLANGWTNDPPIIGDPNSAWGNPHSRWGDYSGNDLILNERTNSQGDLIRSWHTPGDVFPIRQEFRVGGNDIIRNIDEFSTDPFPVDIFVAPEGVPQH